MIAVLSDCDCCRLGITDDDGCAYIVPMNFGYSVSGGALTLYFHCAAEGKKLDLIKKRPFVSFEADCAHGLIGGLRACDCTYSYASVMGKGKVTVSATDEGKRFGLEKLMSRYAKDVGADFSEKYLAATEVLALEVIEWTCKVNKR